MSPVLLTIILILLQTSPVQIKKVLTIGDKPGTEILEAFDSAVDEEGNLYVSDKLEYTIKKFDKNGNLISKIGKRGQGPGEFRAGPGPIACNGNLIAVIDFTTPLVHLFTKELKYFKSIAIPSAAFDIASDGENFYISYVNLWGAKPSTEIAVYNRSGNKLKTFKIEKEENNPFIYFAKIAVIDSFIILGYMVLNQIILLGKENGEIINKISIKGMPDKPKFKEIGELKAPVANIITDIATDDSGKYIFVLADEYTKNPGRDIYVIDKQGNLLQVITLPEKTRFITSGTGHLYSSGKDNTIVNKFKIDHVKK